MSVSFIIRQYHMLHGNVANSKFTMDEILEMVDTNYTIDEVACLEKVTYKCMQKRIERYRKIKDLPPKVIIKNRKINGHWGSKIKEKIEVKPLLSIRDRASDLQKQGAGFSYGTLNRYMKEQGLKTHKREKGIVLTDSHKRDHGDLLNKFYL